MDDTPRSNEEEPWNRLRNPDLSEGDVAWEARPPDQAILDAAGGAGRPAACLWRDPGPGEPVVWCQQLSGLPAPRQVTLGARVRVAEGEARLWVRCLAEDGTPIHGYHVITAPRAAARDGWQGLEFSFAVLAGTAKLEVGGAIPEWGRAWFSDFSLRLLPDDEPRLRAGLVETLAREGSLSTAACRRAFLRVPRHRFVPHVSMAEAYLDVAIPAWARDAQGREVGPVSSSQPTVMATNVGQLRLRPGLRVLEIGAGTGYNAAILAEIVGTEAVTSIDLDREIVEGARTHLESAGYPGLFLDVADGWDGYPERAPYDRIVVTVGVDDLSPAWLAQLHDGGLLVAWLSFGCANLTVSLRKQGHHLTSGPIGFCWGMDLRGKHPRQSERLHRPRLVVAHDHLDEAALAILDEILDLPAEPFAMPEWVEAIQGSRGSRMTLQELGCFLAFAHPLAIGISDPRLSARGLQGTAYALADLERRQLAVAGANLCFGGPEIAGQLRRHVSEWVALGRPGLDRLALAAYPRADYPSAGTLPAGRWMGLVEKEHTWFRWRYRPAARGDGAARL